MAIFQDTYIYGIKKAGTAFDVPFASYSDDVKANIVNVGLGRIMNDLVAGAKTQAEAQAAIEKKLAAWAKGEVRAARVGDVDPVATEARRIAIGKVKASPKFHAWLVENSLKQSDKQATDKLGELAKGLASREDIVAQAKANVAALDDLDIELDL